MSGSSFVEILDKLQGQTQGPQHVGQGAVDAAQPASLTTSPMANDNQAMVTLSFGTQSWRPRFDEGCMFFIAVTVTDPGGAPHTGTVDVELDLPGGNLYRARHDAPNAQASPVGKSRILNIPVLIPSQFLVDQGITGTQTSATLTVVNRSGGNRDITQQLSAYVVA